MSFMRVFLQGKKVERTYCLNQIFFWLRSFPFLGKEIPYSIYSNRKLQIAVYIIHILKTMVTFCLSHFLYLGTIMLISFGLIEDKAINDVVTMNELMIHVLVLLSTIGMIVNCKLFEPTQDKYYSIVLMRLDAKKYAVGAMIYEQIRFIISYSFVGILCVLKYHFPVILWIMIMFGGCIGKYIGCYIELILTKKQKEPYKIAINVAMAATSLAIMIIMMIMGHTISIATAVVIDIVAIIAGLICMVLIWKEKEFVRLYVYHLNADSVFGTKEKINKEQIKSTQKILEYDKEMVSSDKEGYEYFHDLFVKRHRKILGGRTKIFTLVLMAGAVVFPIAIFVVDFFVNIPTLDDIMMMIYMLPLLMYFINTGELCTKAMFINCDGAMLTYNFYRTPEVIRGIFIERLKTIVRLNIIPASVLSVIACEINFFIGIRTDYKVYAIFTIMILSLSVFFSVHRLVVYYLLQPYTAQLEKKSPAYEIVHFATYFISYQLPHCIPERVSNLQWYIATGTIVFTVIYVMGSVNLAYILAPKTFKIRK